MTHAPSPFCFHSRGEAADEVYLNLVMDYIPETIHKCLRTYAKASKLLPLLMTKAYMYQIARSLNYLHTLGVAHRDIKPQNLLLNSRTHHVLLCDCGSAKQLVRGEPNVAYICSRYYRAPELVFEATQYTTSIDLWSCGCVLGEMLHGSPLFPGESAVDQLIEIIKVLGTPTKDEIYAMNPHHTTFKFPSIKAHPWAKVFKGRAPASAIDLISRWLCYEPEKRLPPAGRARPRVLRRAQGRAHRHARRRHVRAPVRLHGQGAAADGRAQGGAQGRAQAPLGQVPAPAAVRAAERTVGTASLLHPVLSLSSSSSSSSRLPAVASIFMPPMCGHRSPRHPLSLPSTPSSPMARPSLYSAFPSPLLSLPIPSLSPLSVFPLSGVSVSLLCYPDCLTKDERDGERDRD